MNQSPTMQMDIPMIYFCFGSRGIWARHSTDPRHFHVEMIGLSPVVAPCPYAFSLPRMKIYLNGDSLLHIKMYLKVFLVIFFLNAYNRIDFNDGENLHG